MKRRQLLEFSDMPWLPDGLRRGITGNLEVTHRVLRTGRLWAPLVARVAKTTGKSRLVDLCSGGGGPLPGLLRELRERHGVDAQATLTDLFPQQAAREAMAAQDGVRYFDRPVDATAVPQELDGIRTLVCGFHHLPPETASRVLRDAHDRRQPICIFEITANHPLMMLAALLLTPLNSLWLCLLARPRSLKHLFLTFCLPVLPLIYAWDHFASNFRTYSPEDLRKMVEPLASPDWRWEVGSLGSSWSPVPLPYLLGYPV